MFDSGIFLLDWLGIIAFTITGALAASRHQMDPIGFILLGTVTGIGGGTLRDVLLDIHPILWIEHPAEQHRPRFLRVHRRADQDGQAEIPEAT